MWQLIAVFLLSSILLALLYGAAKRQLWVLVSPSGGESTNPFREPAR